ncbi:hypothetical protein B0J12DRAFT_30133 [Macrophomina phaseolina]|uniref:Uncharacterized protein n=1 Tax=Macrophomina phaseolina TaxID=35725 RepID=A0ABQ8GVJ6_9PEZI|nr:hypothetical protein B0J12DRAFT_30133 [Macrophomina phaseolina]
MLLVLVIALHLPMGGGPAQILPSADGGSEDERQISFDRLRYDALRIIERGRNSPREQRRVKEKSPIARLSYFCRCRASPHSESLAPNFCAVDSIACRCRRVTASLEEAKGKEKSLSHNLKTFNRMRTGGSLEQQFSDWRRGNLSSSKQSEWPGKNRTEMLLFGMPSIEYSTL